MFCGWGCPRHGRTHGILVLSEIARRLSEGSCIGGLIGIDIPITEWTTVFSGGRPLVIKKKDISRGLFKFL